jgi:hypothetical protein
MKLTLVYGLKVFWNLDLVFLIFITTLDGWNI